jgi:tetratricopeptide (TPR) repeat protein
MNNEERTMNNEQPGKDRPARRALGQSFVNHCSLFIVRSSFFIISVAIGAILTPLRAADPPPRVVESLPAKPPAWLPGFRIRYPLRVAGDLATAPSKTVIARLPTGGWLKPDGSDVAVQSAAGQVIPAAILSHDPSGETIIQFARNANDRWYWAYAVNPGPAPARAAPMTEGLTVEVREWAGDDMGSWPAVLAGLKKSDKVIGNGVVPEVIENCNPARPDDPRRYTTSYRGFLDIKKPGIYRFFVNSEDASFLFIDGFKVCERTGANPRVAGRIPRQSIGADVDLKAGVHPFEVHHVMGDSATAVGYCTLLWIPPSQPPVGWSFLRRDAIAQPLYAEASHLEEAGGAQAACFAYGIDDTLIVNSSPSFLVRVEAQGTIKDPAKLVWDFGDGTTGAGRSVTHVYFKGGSYSVTLRSADNLLPFRRTVHAWPAPTPTSPLSLGLMVQVLAASDWKQLGPERIHQMFDFLLACEQPQRWALLEGVARHMLAEADLDRPLRARAHAALWEALAEQGRAREALTLVEPAVREFAKVPTLQVTVKLATADIHHRFLKDPAEASRLYQAVVADHRRLDHPGVRLAAIRWGDLFAEAGDLARAGETYRLANALGGSKFANTAQAEAVTRGALLRIAEQKLRAGDIVQTRHLLERIELDYPEQKLVGLYRFLRAETDRLAGRYEDAIAGYEFLLKLTQWAGYRDRALFGIADSYNRMGQFDKGLEWLGTVKESFPRFFEKQKLAPYQAMIEGRLKRLQAGKNGRAGFGFTGYRTGFEPEEKQSFGEAPSCILVHSLGFVGPHVSRFEELPVAKTTAVNRFVLENINGDGWYWVELWYRDGLLSSYIPTLIMPLTQTYFYDTVANVNADGGSAINIVVERGYGAWRKFATKLRAPVAQDGRIEFILYYAVGLLDIDGVRIQPISDRQNDSLHSFVEGVDKP